MNATNSFPKLHNATWPGIVGKGPDSEPVIPFDDLLAYTAAAEVDGGKFDGVDIGLLAPPVDINGGADEVKRLADTEGDRKSAVKGQRVEVSVDIEGSQNDK